MISPNTEPTGNEAGGGLNRPKWTVKPSSAWDICVLCLTSPFWGPTSSEGRKLGNKGERGKQAAILFSLLSHAELSSETVFRLETLVLRLTQGAGLWV